MKRTIIFSILCLLAWQKPASAQNGYHFGGLTFNHDLMMAWDFASLSRTQPFGTARVMGMGGAFTSLGADLTAMSINPAGLGMYRRDEFSFTPLFAISSAKTANTLPWSSNSKERFTVGNIGLAINVLENANSSLTSLTVGFAMNRVADFNTRYSFASDDRYNGSMVPSLADVLAQQMNQAGIFPAPNVNPYPDGTPNPNGKLDFRDPYYWPAVLAYKAAMTHVDDNMLWEADAIGPRASIQRSIDAIERGSINECNLSMGANFNNVVYVGASLGIQFVHRDSQLTYGEDYGYFADGDNGIAYGPAGMLPAQLEFADLYQRTVIDGAGVNFKLGVIVRPFEGFRFGVAIHTPTYYSLERSYRAGMDYRLLSNVGGENFRERIESPTQYDEARNSWDFASPTRLMLGVSQAFGRFAILSVDYERAWYNGIRVKNVPVDAYFSPEMYKQDFKENFCAMNTLRAGVEVRPLPSCAVRAGFGFSSSMLRDESLAYEVPQVTTSKYFSLGAGFNFNKTVSLDVAYMCMADKQSSYRLFYSYDQASGLFDKTTALYTTDLTRHFISCTLGIHF